MDLQEWECLGAIKQVYDCAVKLERDNKVLSNKVANLEKELEAYRKAKDKCELVIASDKTLIQDYERKIERLTKESQQLKEDVAKYHGLYLACSTKTQDTGSKSRNTFSSVGSDSTTVPKTSNPEQSSNPKEYRVYKSKDGKVHRYKKVEENRNNGIVLVRWVLME